MSGAVSIFFGQMVDNMSESLLIWEIPVSDFSHWHQSLVVSDLLDMATSPKIELISRVVWLESINQVQKRK